MSSQIESLVNREYQYGFVTDIESDTIAARPLRRRRSRIISAKKDEPAWLLEWRLKAYRRWLTMTEPHWSNVHYPPIDYQSVIYYSAPKTREAARQPRRGRSRSSSRRTRSSASPLNEQKMLAGVAVDAIFDSVSVGTTMQGRAREARHHLLLVLAKRCASIPSSCRSTSAPSCRTSDNFFAALNSRGLLRRLVLLRAEGRALPDGAVDVLPHQRRRTPASSSAR